MSKHGRTLLFWAFIFLIVMMAFVVADSQETEGQQALQFSEFVSKVESGQVKKVTIQGSEIRGTLSEGTDFQAVGSEQHEFIQALLTENKVPYGFEQEPEQSMLVMVLINGLPILLIILLFFFMMRQLQVGGGKAMSFGKSKARLLTEGGRRVTFDDVAGADEAKQELEEIIHFLKDPRKFTRLGGRIPKGVLLMGPPGTGKTLLARAVAGEAGVPFFSISGSDFVEMFVGVGASRVRDLFEQGKKQAPCIIFVD